MNPFETKKIEVISTALVALLLILSSSGLVYAASCTDTDGGIEYSVKGTVTTKDDFGSVTGSKTDECDVFDITKMVEYYCGPGNTISSKMFDCFCNSGKCDLVFSEPDCSYYDYSFHPPAGPVDGCAPEQSCCGSTCVSYGAGETVCCSLDGKKSDVCGPMEICDEGTGKCVDVNCEDTSDPGYCSVCGTEYTCFDGEKTCSETCIDGGGACLSGSEHTSGVYPSIDIISIDDSLLFDYVFDDIEIYYSDIFRCFDGIDNDHDCLIDCADPDCSSETTLIDADGDGHGLKCGLVDDCDDSDPTIWVDCDTTPPEVNITINSGDTYTSSASVTLGLEYIDDMALPSELQCSFSNDGTLYSPWESCAPLKSWTLSGPDGTNTVYVQVKDNFENINDTETDSIILDASPPSSDTRVIPAPSPSFSEVTFETTCSDTVSGCNITMIDFVSGSCIINHLLSEANCKVKLPVECEDTQYDYIANTSDILGNINVTESTFTVKKKDGCSCVESDECYSGSCIGFEFCASSLPPEISFLPSSIDTFQLRLGNTEKISIRLKNQLDMPDTIELKLYGDPSIIEKWSGFTEADDDMGINTKNVYIGPKQEVYVPLNIYGGKLGTYKITADAKSMTTTQRSYNRTTVNIVLKEEEDIDSQTPGIGSAAIAVIIILACALVLKKKKL